MPPDNPLQATTGWAEYRLLVINELERISKEIEAMRRAVSSDLQDLRDRIDDFRRSEIAPMKTELALLKFQAGLWGFAAGTGISLVVAIAARYLAR